MMFNINLNITDFLSKCCLLALVFSPQRGQGVQTPIIKNVYLVLEQLFPVSTNKYTVQKLYTHNAIFFFSDIFQN